MFHYFQWFGSRWLWLCKTISSQVGQCAQVLWRPLALRRLDQPRRSGSWSCALPCLHHPGWVAPRGSPEGEKVVVFLLQPWGSLKSEPAQWNTPGLPLPCQSADGDKECCCSIVVAKKWPRPLCADGGGGGGGSLPGPAPGFAMCQGHLLPQVTLAWLGLFVGQDSYYSLTKSYLYFHSLINLLLRQ